MPAGPNTGTLRPLADFLELYADYKAPHTSNRQLMRDLVMSIPGFGYPILPSEVGLVTLDNSIYGYGDIRRFGADPLGLAGSTVAIRNAVTWGCANNRPVLAQWGTYLLDGDRAIAWRSAVGGAVQVQDTLIPYSSNFTLVADRNNVTFKVANAVTAGGEYRIFGPATLVTNNVHFEDLTIDGNGANNLVIDSGVNVRRAYMISGLTGDNVTVIGCRFLSCPGRNVVNLGNNAANNPGGYDFTNVWIMHNEFRDVGGAIVGNENQSDHSSIYLQADRGFVLNNVLTNTVQPNQFGPPTQHTVNPIEVHGKNSLVAGNKVKNFTHAGVIPAQVHDSINNKWMFNEFIGITQNGLNLSCAGAFRLRKLTIAWNTLEIDNSLYAGGTAIYQNPAAGQTDTPIEDLTIEDNTLYATVNAAQVATWYGIYLCAVERGSIRRNKGQNFQASFIGLEAVAIAVLSIRDLDIDDNEAIDCGIHTAVSRPWMYYISNPSADAREIANIRGKGNRAIRTPQATVFTCRGMNITGVAAGTGGNINNVHIEAPETEGLQRAQRANLNNTTGFRDVGYLPRVKVHARATDPTEGFWQNGLEYVTHSDPVTAGFFGKVPSTSGSAVSGPWVAATRYDPGQWIRNAASTKIFLCITGGVSDPAVEPTSAALGSLVNDGTVVWMYRDTTLAVFKTFGAVS